MRPILRLILFAGTVAALATQPCLGDQRDWTFCYAANFSGKVVYVTKVFESPSERTLLEVWLREQLTKKSVPVENVGCPAPSDFIYAQDRHETAKRFIESLGFTFVPLN